MLGKRFSSLLLISSLIAVLLSTVKASDEDSETIDSSKHENEPRLFGFFSKPHPEAKPQRGVGLKQHFDNILKGGSFGFQAEFGPFTKVRDVVDHAKKFVPFPDFTKDKQPSGVWSDSDDDPSDKHGNIESEDNSDWSIQRPNVGKPEGPKWDDVGEDGDDATESVEGIINPRKRPKRFIDSKIFRVPLEFVSNAKPTEVKVANRI